MLRWILKIFETLKSGLQLATLVPGALRRWVLRRILGPDAVVPVSLPAERGPAPIADCEKLLRDYRNSKAGTQPDNFVLYRIIGNDLFPRHARGQSRQNLRFILENEQKLEGCEKRFVVNRIVDPGEEREVLKLLVDSGAPFIHIPFSWEEYRRVGWDIEGIPGEYVPWRKRFSMLDANQKNRILMRIYRHKNNYVMNNNGARNAALSEGRRIAKWVLPWDGNCFVTQGGWHEITKAIKEHPEIPYYLVPMARVIDNNSLLGGGYRPNAEEEPQIIFRQDTKLTFNPEYFYGRRPKVEFFWRLGVPGKWDKWPVEPWDLPCQDYAEQAGCFAYAGWVARLFSGNANLEGARSYFSWLRRGAVRMDAIRLMLDSLDMRA